MPERRGNGPIHARDAQATRGRILDAVGSPPVREGFGALGVGLHQRFADPRTRILAQGILAAGRLGYRLETRLFPNGECALSASAGELEHRRVARNQLIPARPRQDLQRDFAHPGETILMIFRSGRFRTACAWTRWTSAKGARESGRCRTSSRWRPARRASS